MLAGPTLRIRRRNSVYRPNEFGRGLRLATRDSNPTSALRLILLFCFSYRCSQPVGVQEDACMGKPPDRTTLQSRLKQPEDPFGLVGPTRWLPESVVFRRIHGQFPVFFPQLNQLLHQTHHIHEETAYWASITAIWRTAWLTFQRVSSDDGAIRGLVTGFSDREEGARATHPEAADWRVICRSRLQVRSQLRLVRVNFRRESLAVPPHGRATRQLAIVHAARNRGYDFAGRN